MKKWPMILAVATSATLPLLADEESAAFRVTSDALPISLHTSSGTIRASSAELASRPVTYRAGETVTLTAPDGTAATVVANAADAGWATLTVGAGGDLTSDGLWRIDNSNGGTAFFGVAWGTFGEGWRERSDDSALTLDTTGEGPDRKLKRRETPPVAYSGDDWQGDLAKAATLTFTPPDGGAAQTPALDPAGTGAKSFTFDKPGDWTVTLTFADGTTRTAIVTIENPGFLLIVR